MTISLRKDAAPKRLGNAALADLPAAIERPGYDRKTISAGIAHIGLGSFCRAHAMVYTDDVLQNGATDWGVVGICLMSPAMRDALKPQDGLYTLLIRDNDTDTLRVIGSVLDIMVAPDQKSQVFELLCRPEIRIVTLTVTEKGYCLDAATGNLDEKHPAIVADLANPTDPRSVPGFLTEALRLRREAGQAPFTVLVCDNLAQNGIKARNVVTRFATLRDEELGRFISETVAFPCTMVDRITPATQDSDREKVAESLGLIDAWPVVSEPFRQWVVEDHFPLGRPDWETAGAIMTENVLPYELMKLRCLNGSHSTLAYLSVIAGIETIADAMMDEHLPRVIRHLWDEDLIRTLPPVPGTDVAAYTHDLETRFRNTGVRHLALQISWDGSQKLPPRVLEAAAELYSTGRNPKVIPLTVAAWMRFLSGRNELGQDYIVTDPHAERLTAIARGAGNDAARLADALFGIREIFGDVLPANAHFRAEVIKHVSSLMSHGVRKTLKAFLGEV